MLAWWKWHSLAYMLPILSLGAVIVGALLYVASPLIALLVPALVLVGLSLRAVRNRRRAGRR